MRKFLEVALKSQWKTIILILILVILQTFFQIRVINLFSIALRYVKSHNIMLLHYVGTSMLMYTLLSIGTVYAVSFLSTTVSSKAAYNTREKMFHILMNLPDDEINKFKTTGLISRTTRGVYSEQGFIMLMLEHFIIIPIVFVGIIIEISFIDKIFALLFAAFIIALFIIIIFKLKKITEIYFKAKKTYGKINSLFLSKITDLANNNPIKKQKTKEEFEKACADSYDKNIKYQLSQYRIGPMSLLVLDIGIVILLALVGSEYPIYLENELAADFIVIIQYLLYFITTIVVIPTIIEKWPRAYATSIRLEEVLNLEDKIITRKNSNNVKRIKISKKDLRADDKNIVIDRKKIRQKAKKILNQHKIKLIISTILLTISTLCIVYAPMVAGDIINLILMNSGKQNHTILINVVLLFVLYITGYLLKLLSNRIMVFVGESITYKIRIKLFDKLDVISSKLIEKNSKGQVFSRLNHDLMNIHTFITVHLSELFAQIISTALIIILILTTEWRICLIYIITIFIYILCFSYCDIKSKKQYDNHHKHLGRMMSYLERSLKHRDPYHEKWFERINKKVSIYFNKSRNISNSLVPITTFLTNITNIIVYNVGIYLLVNNEILLGTLLSVIIYVHLLTKPLKKISATMISIENSMSSIRRIMKMYEFKE